MLRISMFLMGEKVKLSCSLCTIHVAGTLHLCLAFMLWQIACVSLPGKLMFVLDRTQDRELYMQTLIIGTRLISFPCQKIRSTGFHFCKAAISSTPIFLLQEICTNFPWINRCQSTFSNNIKSQNISDFLKCPLK